MTGQNGFALLLKNMLPKNLSEGIELAQKNISGAIENFDARLKQIETNQAEILRLLKQVTGDSHGNVTRFDEKTRERIQAETLGRQPGNSAA